MLSQASIIPLWHLSCFTMPFRLLLAECISRTLGDKARVTFQQGVILFSIQVLSFQINLHFLKLQHSVDRVLPSWTFSHWPRPSTRSRPLMEQIFSKPSVAFSSVLRQLGTTFFPHQTLHSFPVFLLHFLLFLPSRPR